MQNSKKALGCEEADSDEGDEGDSATSSAPDYPNSDADMPSKTDLEESDSAASYPGTPESPSTAPVTPVVNRKQIANIISSEKLKKVPSATSRAEKQAEKEQRVAPITKKVRRSKVKRKSAANPQSKVSPPKVNVMQQKEDKAKRPPKKLKQESGKNISSSWDMSSPARRVKPKLTQYLGEPEGEPVDESDVRLTAKEERGVEFFQVNHGKFAVAQASIGHFGASAHAIGEALRSMYCEGWSKAQLTQAKKSYRGSQH